MWRCICLLLGLWVVLSGCSSTTQQESRTESPAVSQYCGRYLFYQVCAKDLDDDDVVDVSFFPDGRQVMLYSKGVTEAALAKAELTFHPCAQLMDEPLVAASTELLWVSDEPKGLKKAKNDLFAHYLRYLPEVTACNTRLAVGGEGDKGLDDFGDEDF